MFGANVIDWPSPLELRKGKWATLSLCPCVERHEVAVLPTAEMLHRPPQEKIKVLVPWMRRCLPHPAQFSHPPCP